jgi:hypothetical protein
MSEIKNGESLRRDESDAEKRKFWQNVDAAASRAPTVVPRLDKSQGMATKDNSGSSEPSTAGNTHREI